MTKNHNYYVYIMASISKKTYTGVTNNLIRRVEEHKNLINDGFTKKYHINKLVYYEYFRNINDAINRETEMKKWRREKKIKLIEVSNKYWTDLYPSLVA